MLGSAVRTVSRVADRLSPPGPGISCLIYHRVGGGSSSVVDLDIAAFEAHIEALAAHHRVITLDQAVAELRGGSVTPGVVVSFDDGTADFAEHAVPVLARHGVPAVLYVATRFVDEQVRFPWDAPPTSWSALRDVVDSGMITVGSHSHGHGLFDRLDPVEAAEDLHRSVRLIEHHLGVRPAHFAYPKAIPASSANAACVHAMFDSAAVARGGPNTAKGFDPYRFRRTPVQRGDSVDDVLGKAGGAGRVEGAARAAAGRWRYRRSTS